MSYAIELTANLRIMQQLGMSELVGDDAMTEVRGKVTMRVRDQPEMLGVLNRLNDLGIEIVGVVQS